MAKQISEEMEEIALHRRLKARMKAFRELRGWNHQRMADFIGISKENYQKYEYDNPHQPLRKVPLVVATRFCDFAGIELSDVLNPKPRRA